MNHHEVAPAQVLHPSWPSAARHAPAEIPDNVSTPTRFIRIVFCLSAFAVPFASIYLPGTGDRVGVVRIVQLLLVLSMVSQPAVCLRYWPVALSWFIGYCAVRIAWGLWMTPHLASEWWPSTFDLLQFSLPWLLFLFNVLRFPGMARKGLWSFALGTSLCAAFHLAGIGVYELELGLGGRSSVFRENANVVGTTYALGIISMVWLLLAQQNKWSHRLLLLGLIPLTGIGLAMTGSRTAAFIVVFGILVLLLQSHSVLFTWRGLLVLIGITLILGTIVYKVPTILKRFDLVRSGDPRTEPRVRMLPVLWEIYQRNPLLGSGPSDYVQELTQRAMPYLLKKNTNIVSHNLLLLLLVETGLLGLFVFGRAFGLALGSAWRARRTEAGKLPLALLLPLALAGTLSSDPHYQPAFWFAMAYGLSGRG